MYFVLFAALALVAYTQTPPTLSDDFVAEVKLDMVNGDRERYVEGTQPFFYSTVVELTRYR